jgi:hypothetical protein
MHGGDLPHRARHGGPEAAISRPFLMGGALASQGDCAVRSFKWMLGITALCAFAAPVMASAADAAIPPAYLVQGADSPIAVYTAATHVDRPVVASELGDSVDNATLAGLSGGTLVQQNTALNGTVSDNSADHVVTGDNIITGGSMAGATGFPTVIQNSGNNVLIQNATVLSVEFKP